MNALRIVLIEDEPVTARNLAHMLQTLDDTIIIVAMLNSVEEAVSWFKASDDQYDLAFMDIRLADGISFDIFKRAEVNRPVIFVTAYHDYAIDAFKNNGIDYILKPFDGQEVKRALHKYTNLIRPSGHGNDGVKFVNLLNQLDSGIKVYRKSFLLQYRGKLIPVEAANVAWYYTANEIVYAHTVEGREYIIEATLEQLEQQVDPQLFYRANRQFIINRSCITEVDFYFNGRLSVKMKPETTEQILISKARATDFKNWMNR